MPVQRETTWAICSGVTASSTRTPPRLEFDFRELTFKVRNDPIGEFARPLIFAPALRLDEFVAGGLEPLLQLLLGAELVLFGMPTRGQGGGPFLKIGELSLELDQSIFRGRICLFLQSLLLDLELNDPAIELVEFFRFRVRSPCEDARSPRR